MLHDSARRETGGGSWRRRLRSRRLNRPYGGTGRGSRGRRPMGCSGSGWAPGETRRHGHAALGKELRNIFDRVVRSAVVKISLHRFANVVLLGKKVYLVGMRLARGG